MDIPSFDQLRGQLTARFDQKCTGTRSGIKYLEFKDVFVALGLRSLNA